VLEVLTPQDGFVAILVIILCCFILKSNIFFNFLLADLVFLLTRLSHMPHYSKAIHTAFLPSLPHHHRFHIVLISKYRYKVLEGQLRVRDREIITQGAEELDSKIVNGMLSADHIDIFAEMPSHISVSDFVKG
jgi:hypothetical protein